MWGGLAIPPAYLNNPEDFFSQNDSMPPMIAFHGMQDVTFFDTFKIVKFAKNIGLTAKFNSESHCLLSDTARYTLYPNTSTPDGYLLGSQNVYEMRRRMCVPAEVYIDSQMHHGLDNTTGTAYTSNFGTASMDAASTGVYIVQRSSIFCQAVLNSKARLLQTTKFVECENYRYSCNTADNNNSCTAGPPPPLCP